MSCENPEGQDEVMPRMILPDAIQCHPMLISMKGKRRFDKSSNCIKCKDVRGAIVVRHAVYCRNCFLVLAAAKFRKCIQPPLETFPPLPETAPGVEPPKPTRIALLAYSGGIGSATLLDIFHHNYYGTGKAKGGSKRKEIWKKVRVCYVETCAAFAGTPDRTADIRALAERYKEFEFVPLKLEDAFDVEWWRGVGGVGGESLAVNVTTPDLPFTNAAHETPLVALQSFFSSLPTPTARTSALQTLTRLLLLHFAQSTNTTHLLLGTSLTSLSISLISSISQGAGFVTSSLREEVWRDNVCVVRPLREMGSKECAAWCRWNNVDVVPGGLMMNKVEGIEKLTRDFITGLEKDYPSTVSAVTRTCGKLVPKGESSGLCLLCERPAQDGVLEWKTRISVNGNPVPSTDSKPIDGASATSRLPPGLDLKLCYACHTTFTSRSSRVPKDLTFEATLPVWVASSLRTSNENDATWSLKQTDEEMVGQPVVRVSRDNMKAQMGDFLLNSEE